MIKVEHLSKEFKDVKALDDVSFDIRPKTVYGFIGKNGAGKSTCLHLISGFLKCDQGTVSLDDKKVNTSNVGYLPEVPILYEWMTPREFLTFLSLGKHPKKVDELLEKVNLKEHENRIMSRFSRGMKQRVGLAAALLKDNAIFLLDEPTSALDPDGRRDVMHIVKMLKREDKSVIFSSHILSDIEHVADEIIMIHQGRLVYKGKMDDQKNQHDKIYLQIDLLDEPNHQHINALSNLDDVIAIESKQNRLKLTLHNDKAYQDILSYIAKYQLKFSRIEFLKKTLDDLLTEVTKHEANLL